MTRTEVQGEVNGKVDGEANPPDEAVRACADDLGIAVDDLVAQLPPFAADHYKSRIFYLRPRDSAVPTHVIKLDPAAAYDPEKEHRALCFAAGLFAEAGERARQLRVVSPVAWNRDPKFLVTRYQPGALSKSSFDAVTSRRPSRESIAEARRQARLIGQWLAVFRQLGVRDGGGIAAADLIAELSSLARDTGMQLRKERAFRDVGKCLERYLPLLDEAAQRELERSYPSRGDARPKNFLAGPDGSLYALDMEGFGYGSLHQDLACMHHSFETEGIRMRAVNQRSVLLWNDFLDECLQPDSSPALALLGYLRFLLGRLQMTSREAGGRSLGRRARDLAWTWNRLRWLAGLSGDLETDVAYFRMQV